MFVLFCERMRTVVESRRASCCWVQAVRRYESLSHRLTVNVPGKKATFVWEGDRGGERAPARPDRG